jgi:hypothetical protein
MCLTYTDSLLKLDFYKNVHVGLREGSEAREKFG